MIRPGAIRRPGGDDTVPGTMLRCEYGEFSLSGAGAILTAEAGASCPPLRAAEREICISLAFGCDGGSGQFSMLAGAGPVAWCPAGGLLPRNAWLPVALSVLAAAESHLAANPRVAALAEAEAFARAARAAHGPERASLQARSAAARRRVLAAVT